MLNSRSLSRQNFFITLGLALVITVIAFKQAGAAENVRKLRLAYAGWEIGTAVAYIGVDAGLFKKHGLEIEELPIRDTLTAGVQSLIGVDLLIGFGNPLAVLQPVANGSDVTVIGSHVSFDQYGMGVGSAIGSVKDLKGKKVGVSALGRAVGSGRPRHASARRFGSLKRCRNGGCRFGPRSSAGVVKESCPGRALQ